MDQPRSLIALVLDRLSVGYLGACGNTWINTPAFDELAAEAFLFDRAISDSPQLDLAYRSYWTGQPAWLSAEHLDSSVISLAQLARSAGLKAVLITDEPLVAEHPLATDFDEIIRLDLPTSDAPTETWEETQLAQFFAAAAEFIAHNTAPVFLWLHTGALDRAWDAPIRLREQYADEDDPEPPALVVPPALQLGDELDPDELLGLRHAYAGQISALDHSLELFSDAITASVWARSANLVLTSPRGYPIGEHGAVGAAATNLYGELIHVPLLIRPAKGNRTCDRSAALVQPYDLYETIAELVGPQQGMNKTSGTSARSLVPLMRGEQDSLRNWAWSVCPGQQVLTTPAWFFRSADRSEDEALRLRASGMPPELAAHKTELFVKPDDFFEANEVSGRCAGVVDEAQVVLKQLGKAAADNLPVSPKLSPRLIEGLEAAATDEPPR